MLEYGLKYATLEEWQERVSMNQSQEKFSAENPKCHIWPERTQHVEHFSNGT